MAREQSNDGGDGRTRSAARRPAGSGEAAPRARIVGLNPDPIASLEAQSRDIADPVEKLRFLRRSLERYEKVDEKLQAVPGAPLRWLAYRVTRVDRTRPLYSANPNGALTPPRRRARNGPRRARRTVNVAALLVVAAAGIALAAYPRTRVQTAARDAAARPLLGTAAETLPPVPRAQAPERVWMVRSGPGFELYSNGLRIDTTFVVKGDPRRYGVFDAETGLLPQLQHRPVGIVFHTSESDIWPLEESFNGKLRDSSRNLLGYLRKNKVYHYLIDRFGQVFRVVEEETKANHAGMSVWSVGRRVYVNLNGPTLGVSFETRWEGGHALPITRAQLEAGRSLTDYLRQKWSIDPEMCLTHGIASVSPQKHLIGHHVDWARGFPFAAFGLPDHYARPSPAVTLFGFGHDEGLVARMGEPWPGVQSAERDLAGIAAQEGRPLAQLRDERRSRYDRWLAEQAAFLETAGRTGADALEPRRHSGGG